MFTHDTKFCKRGNGCEYLDGSSFSLPEITPLTSTSHLKGFAVVDLKVYSGQFYSALLDTPKQQQKMITSLGRDSERERRVRFSRFIFHQPVTQTFVVPFAYFPIP